MKAEWAAKHPDSDNAGERSVVPKAPAARLPWAF